jgi:chromosome partitioning protein
MAIKIAVFSNSGGEEKTTFLMNLAFALEAHLNRKVLLVDADPQCHLTFRICCEEEVETFWSTPAGTLYSVMASSIEESGVLKKVSTYQVTGRPIWLFLGDPLLATHEDVLATAWEKICSGAPRGFAVTSLMNRCVDDFLNDEPETDYVLYELGPSLGSLNRAAILGVDFFIVPMRPDSFSLRATLNLGKTIGNWCQTYYQGLESLGGDVSHFVRGQPKFLGYFIQQNRVKWDKREAYQRGVDALPEIIENHIVKTMQDTVPYPHDVPLDTAQLGSIKNYHHILPMALEAHKPLFELGFKDGVRGADFGAVDTAKEIFYQSAEAIEKQIRRIQS